MPGMRKWFFGVGGLLLFLAAFLVGVHRDFTLECQNTWSTCGYRQWFGFLKTSHWKKPSVLEGFILQNYQGEFTNRWRVWNSTPPASLLGGQLYCGHPVPPKYGKWVDQYITGVSDAEKKALYDFFRTAESQAVEDKFSNIFVTVYVER